MLNDPENLQTLELLLLADRIEGELIRRRLAKVHRGAEQNAQDMTPRPSQEGTACGLSPSRTPSQEFPNSLGPTQDPAPEDLYITQAVKRFSSETPEGQLAYHLPREERDSFLQDSIRRGPV